MTTTTVLFVIDGQATTVPVETLLPPAPPFRPFLVARGCALWAALTVGPWAGIYAAVSAVF